MITFWNDKEESAQKTVVLKYWLKELKRFTSFQRVCFISTKLVPNTTQDKKTAFKALASFYKVPAKKKGETVSEQSYRFKCL